MLDHVAGSQLPGHDMPEAFLQAGHVAGLCFGDRLDGGQRFGAPGDQFRDGDFSAGSPAACLQLGELPLDAISPGLGCRLGGEGAVLVFVAFAAHHGTPAAVSVLQCRHRCTTPCCAKAFLAQLWYRQLGKRGKNRDLRGICGCPKVVLNT